MKIKILLRKIIRKIRGTAPSVDEWRSRGVSIGTNCHIYGSIDDGHEFLVTIGNNVTLASGCRVLTHDGSTKKIVGYSRVGRVDIGNDVFVGAGAIILPGVRIGNKVIIGAGSVVTNDIPDNVVAVGSPARIIGCYDEYVRKTEEQFRTMPRWETYYKQKTQAEKTEMRDILQKSRIGFDV